jgi:hypothetical protein
VILTGRRHPHEWLLVAVTVVAGASFLVGAPRPASVEALMPGWQITLWAGFLLTSGLLGLVALVVRRVDTGLAFEAAAMLVGAAATFAYALAVFTAAGWRGLLPGGITIAWSLANVWRFGQIRADQRILDQ